MYAADSTQSEIVLFTNTALSSSVPKPVSLSDSLKNRIARLQTKASPEEQELANWLLRPADRLANLARQVLDIDSLDQFVEQKVDFAMMYSIH